MLAPFSLMTLTLQSPCKVNLLLNILGKRPDGFHELETVMHPVGLHDQLDIERTGAGVQLTCSDSTLAVDGTNLVHRAAASFLQAAQIKDGVRIHLEKNIPMAAGLGGGSADAATTLLGLNRVFDGALGMEKLTEIAATLGSDVPFFLQNKPALGVGRGEKVTSLERFPALAEVFIFLVRPGFGIATAWAYQQLAKFPKALNGEPGRAQRLITKLQGADLAAAGAEFYNSLEAPALHKYPLLALFQDFMRANGAVAALMSGSGSTSFALVKGKAGAETMAEKFKGKFGDDNWSVVVPL
jgi:4-diphosphocytidyl-2-C-methyl-D-erythritol kinase